MTSDAYYVKKTVAGKRTWRNPLIPQPVEAVRLVVGWAVAKAIATMIRPQTLSFELTKSIPKLRNGCEVGCVNLEEKFANHRYLFDLGLKQRSGYKVLQHSPSRAGRIAMANVTRMEPERSKHDGPMFKVSHHSPSQAGSICDAYGLGLNPDKQAVQPPRDCLITKFLPFHQRKPTVAAPDSNQSTATHMRKVNFLDVPNQRRLRGVRHVPFCAFRFGSDLQHCNGLVCLGLTIALTDLKKAQCLIPRIKHLSYYMYPRQSRP